MLSSRTKKEMTVPIFSDLDSHARRYEKLKGVFAEFHAHVLNLPKFGGPPPDMEALVVGDLVAGRSST